MPLFANTKAYIIPNGVKTLDNQTKPKAKKKNYLCCFCKNAVNFDCAYLGDILFLKPNKGGPYYNSFQLVAYAEICEGGVLEPKTRLL